VDRPGVGAKTWAATISVTYHNLSLAGYRFRQKRKPCVEMSSPRERCTRTVILPVLLLAVLAPAHDDRCKSVDGIPAGFWLAGGV